MTERRVGAEQQRRLEREGFRLEVTRAGKRFWRERPHDDLVFAVATSVGVAERLMRKQDSVPVGGLSYPGVLTG